jgi:superfamily II DNA or RNA helicase
MMVADEVHQLGSVFNSRAMSIESGSRLGLSATPSRYGDPAGTQQLVDYFGAVLQPPFTLNDAIAAGRLVEYEYYPKPVTLTAEEAQEWSDQTSRIRLEIARQGEDASGRKPLTERAKLLLIQRSRIAKKAFNKVALARQVLGQAYERGSSWLVYCEDAEQLREVMQELASIGLDPVEYHSAMAGDRAATLNWFKEVGGVLVSIKCLDEGVDIPAVSHALILASSQNPRQFIQRRGRVLRAAPGKATAVIYDAIVVPAPIEDEPDQAAIWRGELSRALEFARSAMNRSAGAELREIAIRRGLPIDEVIDTGLEEEGE